MWRRDRTLQVACACDEGYLPHCAAMLHSLLTVHGPPVRVHLLCPPETPDEGLRTLREWLAGLGAELSVVRVPAGLLDGVRSNFSPLVWYRVLAPDLLPGLDRVLFLDCDLIVTDSLEPLRRKRLRGNLIGAVTNLPMTMEWMERRVEALGIPDVDGYFNAGVMLMDLRGLREGGWPGRVLDWARAHDDGEREGAVDEDSPESVFRYVIAHPERMLFAEQDALNAVLHEHRLRLHPRWNSQLLFRRFETRTPELTEEVVREAVENPAIRHFEGPGHSKPWHPGAGPEDRDLYMRHRALTPWPLSAPG